MSEPEHEPQSEPEPVAAPVRVPEPQPEPGPDDEPGAPQEPSAPEPEPVETQALLEERGKRFEKLSQHVAKRTGEILGEDATIVQECPLCTYWGMPGWIPTVDPPQDLQAHLMHYMGQRAASDFQRDQYSAACSKCNGLGEVLTGSHVFGQERLPCFDCKGMGWIAVGDERRSGVLALANGVAAPSAPLAPADAAMSPAPLDEPPEVAALRSQGYLVVAPLPA